MSLYELDVGIGFENGDDLGSRIEERDDVDSIVRYGKVKSLFARNAMACECVRVPASF